MVSNLGECTNFGRYVLLEKIGAGGMAEIYRAKTFGAAGFEKEFAIKLILPSLVDDDEFVEMFINEAKIAVSLYHTNVVQVFDLGEIDGQYYIAMEYVRGRDLLEVLARCAERNLKIPLDLVLFITMEMLKGLSFAHRATDPYGEPLSIIHRDVSPSNIMMSYTGDVKVGDFGVAKAAIQRTLTESGTLKGKVGYMSPEQVMGEAIDARSDVFAAGIVFFEALSMSRLFVGDSDLEVMLQVRDAKIQGRLDATDALPSGLREIVERALSKHREERYQTTGEFYQALVDFCYRYSIKVTGSDLSNFMRRLFREEIELEKARLSPRPEPREKSAAVAAPAPPPPPEEFPMSEAQLDEAPSKHAPARPASKTHANPIGSDFYDAADFESSADSESQREAPSAPVPSVKAHDKPSPDTRQTEAHDLGDAGSDAIPGTIPFELSSSVFHEDDSLEEISPVFAQSADFGSLDELITTEFEGKRNRPLFDRVRQAYATYEGDLAEVPFARILARLYQSSATGRLLVRSGSVEKSIYMRGGEPILVVTNKKSERLGAFALRANRISADQLSEALDRLDEWGGRLGDALVAIGAVEAHEIFALLSDQMREKLLDVFTWPSGYYGYFENQEPSTMGYPLGIDTYLTIAEACRNVIPLELIRRYYEGREHVDIYKISHPPISVNRLKMTARELRIYTQIRSGTSLSKCLQMLDPARLDMALRLGYMLHQVEVLKFENEGPIDLPSI
ncbi:protein kinase domain-containing protein [Bradymonas sediminis]|nr:protein kinase [Bradymonas sediminis]TDP75355.1 serine/threonine protein kinase [Bradymonas sediminis]